MFLVRNHEFPFVNSWEHEKKVPSKTSIYSEETIQNFSE